jgi:mannose-6-phosphate isomerase-like protein (cupin superfamily)
MLMPRPAARPRYTSLLPWAIALVLGLAWASREVVHARERASQLASQTINLDQIKMAVFKDKDQPVGHIGLYNEGETAGCSSLVTGRFVIDPGKSPHTPHVHEDEEIMVIESGHGEIFCDGKTTPVGPGSVMYTEPNVSHGINNTGGEPLTFYFVKWIPRRGSSTR